MIGVAAIILITLGNLRGLRESGNIFAIPTYLFVGSALLMIAIGVFRIVVIGEGAPPPDATPGSAGPAPAVGLLLIIRAFASGSVALTGTEAIANGVPAFKPPEPRNAATTLTVVAVLLAVLFLGITFVADSFGIVPDRRAGAEDGHQPGRGHRSTATARSPFYLFQTFTALILFLAANTSYNAFPRLAAILARDGYMPRQFSFRGDRLAFTSGIVILSVVAIALLVVFRGNTHALIPLYSVGVFIVVHDRPGRHGPPLAARADAGWRWRLAINGFGCALTGARRGRRHDRQGADVAARRDRHPDPRRDDAVHPPPVPGVGRAARGPAGRGHPAAASRGAGRRAGAGHQPGRRPGGERRPVDRPDVQAVLISDEPEEAAAIRARWERQLPDVPLVIVESPYRALVAPLLAYLDVLDRGLAVGQGAPITFVVIPEYVARSWWERILYNQSAKRLRTALLGRPHTVVVNVPYRREDSDSGALPRAESDEAASTTATTDEPTGSARP